MFGSNTAAALMVACTVHHATRKSAATSATARPESITAASSAVLSRVVHRARAGSWSVAAMMVRRAQAGSAHTNLGLRTTTSTRPACGISRTRCITQACTRDDTTPAVRTTLVKCEGPVTVAPWTLSVQPTCTPRVGLCARSLPS
jgi:hypothetical protein